MGTPSTSTAHVTGLLEPSHSIFGSADVHGAPPWALEVQTYTHDLMGPGHGFLWEAQAQGPDSAMEWVVCRPLPICELLCYWFEAREVQTWRVIEKLILQLDIAVSFLL